jgi:hypothetical protein
MVDSSSFIGQTIPHWRLTEKLGGGMDFVNKAENSTRIRLVMAM